MFNLKDLFLTIGIKELLEEEVLNVDVLVSSIARHLNNESEVDEEDRNTNLWAINNNKGRVLNSYTFKDIKFWIITELDRKYGYTTILLPSEY